MYNYLTDREELVYIVSKYKPNKQSTSGFAIDSVPELNQRFEENISQQAWKKRYNRAKKFLDLYSLKVPEAKAQYNTEGHLRRLGALEFGRASVLTEEALHILEQEAKKVPFNREFHKTKTEDEYIFVTSDFHFNGDENDLEALNKVYNHILDKQKEFGFKKIKLLELGDVVEGSHLRPSQLLSIKQMLIPQIINVSRSYVQLLEKLTETMAIDFYCVTSSNHTQTRAFGTGRNELVEDDAMLIFAEIVKVSMSKNKNFKFTAGRDFIVPVTNNHSMFVAHGHLIAGKKNGYVQELAMARGLTFQYALFGHFHHYREVTLYGRDTFNMKVFYAPSMNSKHSDYEFDKNLTSKAAILIMVFNKERGQRYCEELFV
jgi:hypothetical protein